MTNLRQRIQDLAKAWHPQAVRIRRHLHQYPELSFQEEKTAAFIAAELDKLGIPYQTGVAGTGIVATLSGNAAEPVVALRGDIDALPILEKNDVPYASKNEGVMHACGHDVHTTNVLGAAFILKQLQDELPGTVRLIFQPGEEQLPGGASLMIKEGVLENPKPALIIGQHVHPPLEAGKVGFRPGKYMASADEIYIRVIGKGGHGALPHTVVDPILISAHLITALQQVVSRFGDPTIPSVLTIGKINSQGGATNVVPNEVHLEGTFRTMNEAWRTKAHEQIRTLAENLALSMGGKCEIEIRKGYPFLQNHERLTHTLQEAAQSYLGGEYVDELPIRMTAEDFAYYSQEIPACFYRLGVRNAAQGITSSVHTNTFDIDEERALPVGCGLMAYLAIQAFDFA